MTRVSPRSAAKSNFCGCQPGRHLEPPLPLRSKVLAFSLEPKPENGCPNRLTCRELHLRCLSHGPEERHRTSFERAGSQDARGIGSVGVFREPSNAWRQEQEVNVKRSAVGLLL